MGLVEVARVTNVGEGEMKGVEAGGKEILIANVDGTHFAIGNRCTHMGCMLSNGALKGETVTCSCHGSVFSLKTGNVVKGPAKKPESVFALKVEGEKILADV